MDLVKTLRIRLTPNEMMGIESSRIIRNLRVIHVCPIGEFDSVINRTDDTRKVRAIRKAKLATDPSGSRQGS
jgi:hypothetical protein